VRHYLNLSLLLYAFGTINPSEAERTVKSESYKKYFAQQEELFQELVNLGISGARPLDIDAVLAEQVLVNCPDEIDSIVQGIERDIFWDFRKSFIFHGPSGTGKSCLAQAIAIKTQTPCLFFNSACIATWSMNSGVHNLNKIFEHAKKLEERLGKPCVVIFDELGALSISDDDISNFRGLWNNLDLLSRNRMIVISTLNRTDDLPTQLTGRSSMIEIPLPNLEQREAILSYHLKAQEDKYGLIYADSKQVTAGWLARLTKGFSNRDLEDVVTRAIDAAISAPVGLDASNKTAGYRSFISAINQKFKQKLARKIGTWKRTFKTCFRDPQTATFIWMAVALIAGYNALCAQKDNLALKKMILDQTRSQDICEYSENAEKIDPELYEVFLKMKNDYGITDEIDFRILPPFDQLTVRQQAKYVQSMLMYEPNRKIVLIQNHYKWWPKGVLINGIAHELEHHRQHTRMSGSYFDRSQDIENNIDAFNVRSEIGADAAAADYSYCSKCLKYIAICRGLNHEPQETDLGYITTPKGYFSKKDYELYIDRAKEDGALCPAHQRPFSIFRLRVPLKDYLPTK
jgi:hypothetical protein